MPDWCVLINGLGQHDRISDKIGAGSRSATNIEYIEPCDLRQTCLWLVLVREEHLVHKELQTKHVIIGWKPIMLLLFALLTF